MKHLLITAFILGILDIWLITGLDNKVLIMLENEETLPIVINHKDADTVWNEHSDPSSNLNQLLFFAI